MRDHEPGHTATGAEIENTEGCRGVLSVDVVERLHEVASMGDNLNDRAATEKSQPLRLLQDLDEVW